MQHSVSQSVDELLSGDPKDCVAAVQERVQRTLKDRGHSLILFGSGQLGRVALDRLERIGKPPIAFADNNPALWGTKVGSIPVLAPDEAQAKFPESLFVITVYTNAPVKRQLRDMGAEALTFAELAWCYPDSLLPWSGLDLPDKIWADAKTVKQTYHLWADEFSRREFVGQIGWRSTLESSALPPHSPVEETYFPPDLFDFQPDEVMVDCGAFDGDSIRAFLQRVGNSFKAAVGLEPDPLTRIRFEKWRDSLSREQAEKIYLLPYATGDKRDILSFESTGTAASALGSGQIKVECLPLDESVAHFAPSFIKMDIEGAESATVRGAKGIIREPQPIVAVCLYHAQEHLWQIPSLLHSLNPDYRLFLRRYSDEGWELVCYAVPRERCKI